MVKNIRTLTVNEYENFTNTGNLTYLCRWWVFSYIVALIMRRKCLKLAEAIDKRLNKENRDGNLEKEIHKGKSKARIMLLIGLYLAMKNLLVHGIYINRWRGKIGKQPVNFTNLKEYVDKIKTYCGIEIKDISDLRKLEKEIERRTDKYEENFPVKKEVEQKEGLTFGQLHLGVISDLNLSLNPRMTMQQFFDALCIYEKRQEQLKKQYGKDNG